MKKGTNMKEFANRTVTIPCYPSITAFVNDQNRIKKLREDNMKSQKEMGHFIDWEFGVPVRVQAKHQVNQEAVSGEARLIDEDLSTFIIVHGRGGVIVCHKQYYYYELIPHKYGGPSGGAFSPRYPVCSTPNYTAFCNAQNQMTSLDAGKGYGFKQYSTATLIIDGEIIELSAEIAADLKSKLEVRPVIMDVNSAVRLREYMEENNLQHLLPPVRSKIKFNHLNLMLLAPKYRAAVLQEKNRDSVAAC